MREKVELTSLDEIEDLLGKERVREIAEAVVEEETYDKTISVYWDYQDIDWLKSLVCEKLLEMKDMKSRSFEENKQRLLDMIFEENLCMDYFNEQIDQLKRKIENKCLDDINEKFEVNYTIELDYAEFDEFMYDEIGLKLDDGIVKHIEDIDMNVNMMMQYQEEANYDFSTISEMNALLTGYSQGYSCATLLDDYYENKKIDESSKNIIESNMLTYLIYQQGYTLEDVMSDKDNAFLNSVRQELDNMSNVMNTLTALVRVDVDTYIQFMSSDCPNINISKNTENIGIFAPWVGGGSILEIELEKDFIIDKDMIWNVQIEGRNNDEYTVDKVYGLVSSCWNNTVSFTEEATIEKPQIDFKKVILEMWKRNGMDITNYLEQSQIDNVLDSKLNAKSNGSLTVKEAFDYLGIEEENYERYLNDIDFLIDLENMDREALENGTQYAFVGDEVYLGLKEDDVMTKTENFIQFKDENSYGNFKSLESVVKDIETHKDKNQSEVEKDERDNKDTQER